MGNQQERPLTKITTTYNGKKLDDHIVVSEEGFVYKVREDGLHKIPYHIDKVGYPKISLKVEGRHKTVMVHRLLAQAFLPNPHNKRTVNHIDSDRANNELSNLEWATFSENNKHAYTHGKQVRKVGEEMHNASMSNEQAIEAYEKMLNGVPPKEVSESLGKTIEVIWSIRDRRSYRELTKGLPDIPVKRNKYKVTPDIAESICELLSEGCTSLQVLSKLNVDGLKIHHIKDIKRRKTQVQISCNYDF